jgi:hypothetical protein
MTSTVNDLNAAVIDEKDSPADDSPIREVVFSIMLSASKTGLDDDLNFRFLIAAIHVQV